MAYVLTPISTHEENRRLLESSQPLQVSSAGGGAQPQAQAQNQPSAPSPAAPQEQAPNFGNVAQPIERGLQSGREELGAIKSQFYNAAGPSRTFESPGVRDAIERVPGKFDSAEDRASAFGRARELIGADYGGPTGFDADRTSALEAQTQALGARSSALSGGGGLEALLGRENPGLTPGAARSEAQRKLGQPGYRAGARQYQESVQSFMAEMEAEKARARQFAEERESQEAGIATQSRDFLTKQRDDVSAQIANMLEQARGREKSAMDAYSAWEAGGATPEGLAAIDPGLLGFDPAVFQTQAKAKQAEADRVWGEIMARAPEGFTPGGLSITSHGTEARDAGPIQDALEKRFSPGTANSERGDLAEYRSLYGFGGPENSRLELPNESDYVYFNPGVSPSRENVSSEDQRRIFNQINEFLDQADRIGEAGDPYQAAQIAADVDAYLKDEQDALNQRGRQLDEFQQNWKTMVNQARRGYKKRKKRATWGKVASILLPVISGGSWGAVKGTPGASTSSNIVQHGFGQG